MFARSAPQKHAGHDLVAVRDAHERVEGVPLHRAFQAVGNDLARDERVVHAGVVHGNAVAHADGGHLERHAAGQVRCRPSRPRRSCPGCCVRGMTSLRELNTAHERAFQLLVGDAVGLRRLRCGARAMPRVTALLLSCMLAPFLRSAASAASPAAGAAAMPRPSMPRGPSRALPRAPRRCAAARRRACRAACKALARSLRPCQSGSIKKSRCRKPAPGPRGEDDACTAHAARRARAFLGPITGSPVQASCRARRRRSSGRCAQRSRPNCSRVAFGAAHRRLAAAAGSLEMGASYCPRQPHFA